MILQPYRTAGGRKQLRTPGLMAALAVAGDPLPKISAELRRRASRVPSWTYHQAMARPVDPEWMAKALACF